MKIDCHIFLKKHRSCIKTPPDRTIKESDNTKFSLEKLKSEHTDDEIALLRRAYEFAARAHEGQKRKSGEAYISHPLATAERLVEMRLDAPAIAAAFLHDVCEDTKYTIKDIQKEFGEE